MNEYGLPAPGFRLPAETRPGRVRLQVADLERSLEFYEGVLGFRRLGDTPAGAPALGDGSAGATVLGNGSALIELHERTGAGSAAGRALLGLYHFAVLLPDRSSLARLLAHLSERSVPLGASDHGVSEALYLRDPDGLGIELYADRPREKWVVRDSELGMKTEPLAVDDLLRSDDGSDWDGAPAGTAIGHLHLNVGALEGARAFYHEALGLDITVWSYPSALFMSAGGYHHHLGVNTWAGPMAAPASEDDARLLDWELIVPDTAGLDAAVDSLRRHGHAVESHTDAHVARDPWGTALRLTAEPNGA